MMKFTQLSENLSPRSYDPPPSCDPDEDPPYTIEQLNLVSSFSVFTNHIIPQFNCRAEKSKPIFDRKGGFGWQIMDIS